MQIPLFQHAVLPLKKLLLSTILGCWAHYARFYIAFIFMIYKDFIVRKLFRTVVRAGGNLVGYSETIVKSVVIGRGFMPNT